jgi:hypothetical protein
MKRKIYPSLIKIKAKLFKNKVILVQCSFKLKTSELCLDRIINKLSNIIKKRVSKHLIEYCIQRAIIMEIKHNLLVIKIKRIKIKKSLDANHKVWYQIIKVIFKHKLRHLKRYLSTRISIHIKKNSNKY